MTFKDLGLLIIDEEQKFGVSTKEKLRKLKTNVDTLTMTATPIPRTLQFSLMGARDMSIIRPAQPNRYPICPELHTFGGDTIAEAVNFEMARGGQVFFVNNLSELYVPGSSERMLLYRELDHITDDEALERFMDSLRDRFGEIPREGMELLRVVPLRRLGKRLGCEKIMLKQGQMTMIFVSNPDNALRVQPSTRCLPI